jgi:crotonobetainyl-CoA:carnitine CoA-transferase CaiB-like acyl-CoA transferase
MVGPLEGWKVLDLSQGVTGPYVTKLCSDYGADVIKVERPGTGDLSRTSIPNDPAGLQGPVFCSLNRNKRSIVLDTRQPQGREAALRLIERCDVVVNNFRAGVMERMGFGYEALSRLNPRLIYAVGTGYGLTGPYAHKGGQDALAQAMSGVMARRADPSVPVSIPGTTFADYSAGMHLVQGVLLALLQRVKTGRGQLVSVSLLDSMIAAQMQEGTMHLMRQRELNWSAMPLSGAFATRDGALVLVGAFKTEPLRDIAAALELPALADDPRFASFELQMKNRPALHKIFADRFRQNTTAHWLARLDAQDLLCAPVRPLAEALADPQVAINQMVLEAPGAGATEPLRVVGSPVHLSDAPVKIRIAPPRLGQHTAAVLAELGLTEMGAA